MVLGMRTKQEKSNQNFHPSRKRELKLSGGLILWKKIIRAERSLFRSSWIERESQKMATRLLVV